MPRFRNRMLLRCPIEDFNLCEDCPYYDFVAFELNCQGDCPTCPTATVNRCPCVDVERVRAYWRDREIDDHVLLSTTLLVDSTLDDGDVTDLDGLVESIRRHRLIFPLVVRPYKPGRFERYEVVVSQRMLVAVRAAGLIKVPCIIKERLTDEQALQLIHDVDYYFNHYQEPRGGLFDAVRGKVIQFPKPVLNEVEAVQREARCGVRIQRR